MGTKDKKKQQNKEPETVEDFLDMIGWDGEKFKPEKKRVKITFLCLTKSSGYFQNFIITM